VNHRPQLASAFLALVALPTACRAPAMNDTVVVEVTDVLEAQQAAWNAGDVEAFMARGYQESPELTFLSGGDWTRGYAPVLARYRRNYVEGDRRMGRLAFADLEVEPLGRHHALARGRWALDLGGGEGPSGLFTLVLREIDGRWRIVHDHTSSAAD